MSTSPTVVKEGSGGPHCGNGDKPRILVLDDEPEILDLCVRLLRDKYDLRTATSVEEAFVLLRDAPCCVAIVDQHLAGLDGTEFLSRLQNTNPDIGRIVITGQASQERVITAINAGKVHAFILKPWKPDEFKREVGHVVELSQLRQRVAEEHDRYRRLVYDDQSDLPTRHLIEEQAGEQLRHDGCLGVLVIDASAPWIAPFEVGAEAFQGARTQFIAALRNVRGRHFRNEDVLAIDEIGGSSFYVLLARPRTERTNSIRDIAMIAARLQTDLSERLLEMRLPGHESWPRAAVGHGFVLYNRNIPVIHQVRGAFREARDNAQRLLASGDADSGRSQLEELIVAGNVRTVFQAIKHVHTQKNIGYEALSRGPENTPFESPAFLLRIADRTGQTAELDHLFRATALAQASRVPADAKIFVNSLPQSVMSPDMQAHELAAALAKHGVASKRVVIEFSERYTIHNEKLFSSLISAYCDVGIQIAIDDVGVGYSGLERIAQLKPHYLKIDMSLVTGVDSSSVKRALVSAIQKLADETGAAVIAEGVETEAELACLRDIGVQLAQGFLFGQPAAL